MAGEELQIEAGLMDMEIDLRMKEIFIKCQSKQETWIARHDPWKQIEAAGLSFHPVLFSGVMDEDNLVQVIFFEGQGY